MRRRGDGGARPVLLAAQRPRGASRPRSASTGPAPLSLPVVCNVQTVSESARGIDAGAARVLKVMKSTPYLAPHQRRFSAMRCVTGTGFLLISVIINGAHAALSSVKH